MIYRPVIFLAFANDQDAYLGNLQREEDLIYASLQQAHDSGYIEIYNRGRATTDDIFAQFTRFRDRVAIFHYGGHANSSKLRLTDKAAGALGLAGLMGQQRAMQLVFLNGCSTGGQVDQLMQAGVKAIIATSVPIEDNSAVLFAQQFYQSLADHATLKQAFKEAVSRLVTSNIIGQQDAQIRQYRDWAGEIGKGKDHSIPWGLYVEDEKVLNWKLPGVDKRLFTDPWLSANIESREVNRHIVMPVFEAMAAYDESFVALLTPLQKAGGNDALLDLMLRQIMDLIIKHFPWPVGVKLRTLFSSADSMVTKNLTRIQQLCDTYIRLGRFLLYILIARLWDIIADEKDPEIRDVMREEMMDMLLLNPNNNNRFDYWGMLSRMLNAFDENGLDLFMEELKEIHQGFTGKDKYYQAYLEMEKIRNRLSRNEIGEEEWEPVHDACEYYLSQLLQQSAFLVTYQLISIKEIGISNPKRKPASFKHQLGVLAGVAIEVMEATPKNYEEFTDSHSILLVKGMDQVSENVNLSPLIIDLNAYKGINSPKIYLYAFNQDFQNFFYEHVDNDSMEAMPELISDARSHLELIEQFQLLKSEMT